MQAAAQGVFGTASIDPVCGMEVDQKRAAAAGRTSDYRGATYYFCGDDCKKKFDAEPAKFAETHDHAAGKVPAMKSEAMPMQADGKAAGPAAVKDLVCGMDVDPKEAVAAKLTSEHQGKTYYFCSDLCKKKFDADPAKFARK
jgi:YHS domain-containing protein